MRSSSASPAAVNGHENCTAVGRGARPGNEPALLQPVEHAGDVGRPRHQSLGQRERRHRLLRGPQQAKKVVLLGGKVEAGEELVFEHPKAVVRSPQGEVCLLLGRVEPRDLRCV